jgi:hypothetical protein
MVVYLAGRKLRASELQNLEDRLTVVENPLVLDVGPITADSSGWTTSTRVVTNVAGIFTAIQNAEYEVTIRANVIHDTGAKWCTAGIAVHDGGPVTAADVPISSVTEFADTGGAVRNCSHSETFVAATSGTYGVAIVGWIALGTGGTAKLHGTAVASGFTNGLTVKRVG